MAKLQKVITGHDGWIHDLSVDVSNTWFATASADCTVKVWSIVGKLKLTLTGHRMPVRSVKVSEQLPYLFSGGEDRAVYCWDLETNKICRHFHGHASGVYCVDTHPTIPYLLFSGSRDQTVRMWDVRTRQPIHVLQEHTAAVNCVSASDCEPQLISGGADGLVVLWDIVAGKPLHTLTHHQRSVRSLVLNPDEYTFASGSADGINQYKLPNGELLGSLGYVPSTGIVGDSVTSMTCFNNRLFAGYDSGKLAEFDYNSGTKISELKYTYLQNNFEQSVLCSEVDFSQTRLITGHMDKAIRIWNCDPEESDH